ncbi:hypothetical protein BH18CHL1_BH18CHL1_06410 [soil metagenome]
MTPSRVKNVVTINFLASRVLSIGSLRRTSSTGLGLDRALGVSVQHATDYDTGRYRRVRPPSMRMAEPVM